MLTLRTHSIITASILAAIIVLAAIGNALHDNGLLADSSGMQTASAIVFFGLCAALGFSAVPLMVKLVLGVQVRIGNAGRPLIAGLIVWERAIVFALWALIALGLAIAVPAAIIGGAFD